MVLLLRIASGDYRRIGAASTQPWWSPSASTRSPQHVSNLPTPAHPPVAGIAQPPAPACRQSGACAATALARHHRPVAPRRCSPAWRASRRARSTPVPPAPAHGFEHRGHPPFTSPIPLASLRALTGCGRSSCSTSPTFASNTSALAGIAPSPTPGPGTPQRHALPVPCSKPGYSLAHRRPCAPRALARTPRALRKSTVKNCPRQPGPHIGRKFDSVIAHQVPVHHDACSKRWPGNASPTTPLPAQTGRSPQTGTEGRSCSCEFDVQRCWHGGGHG